MTDKQRIADLEAQLDVAMTNLSRHAHESWSYRRAYNRLYERNRRLENAVRRIIVVGERVDTDALYQLRQMVPNQPRKTLRQLSRGRRA